MKNISFYNVQIELSNQAIQQAKANYRLWAIIRLAIFLSLCIGIYFSWGNWLVVSGIVFAGIVLFLFAISRFQDAKTALSKSKKWNELITEEVNALETEDYSYFEDGAEFKDAKHPFTYDMDVFGKGSVFPFINRTFSASGKQALANYLSEGAKSTDFVNRMIIGLCEQMAWVTQFRVNGSIDERKESLDVKLSKMTEIQLGNPKWFQIGRFVLATIGILNVVAFSLSLINSWVFVLLLLLNVGIVGKYVKQTNAIIATLTQYEGKIKFVIDQMNLIKELKTEDATLKEFIGGITKEGDGAIDSMKHWVKIQNKFEYRMNLLVGFILNALVVWDIHQRINLEKWLQSHSVKVGEWEQSLIELEVYLSGAILSFNHPEAVFASFNEEEIIAVQSLKHPLISADKVIGNDVKFDAEQKMMILTGPNMAGKSTFLRSVGLMFIFANAGFPVFASAVNIPRYRLFTSMRTSDDLTTDSSYFYAELSRLKFILNEIEKDSKIFILLDEILKGTNSIDKEQGSKQFLRKLERLDTKGIIATHDLSLCELSTASNYFYNGYFDSIIQNDELYFDYIWREGVCQNMNASFLLKKMNLID